METLSPGTGSIEERFSPEQRLYQDADLEKVADAHDIILDRIGDDLDDLTLARFRELKKESLEEREAFGNPDDPNAIENHMFSVFWRMDEIIGKQNTRAQLIQELEHDREAREPVITDEKRQKKIAELHKVNALTAEWQNDIVRVTLGLAGSPRGREFLKTFWQTYEKINTWKDEVRRTKTGIMGVITTIRLLESKGCQVALPTGEQDAVDKIDLFASHGENAYAIQIKSHDRQDIRVRFEVLSEQDPLVGDEKTQRARRNLMKACYKYSKQMGQRIRPAWMDLDCPGGTRLTRDELGLPNLEGIEELDLGTEI